MEYFNLKKFMRMVHDSYNNGGLHPEDYRKIIRWVRLSQVEVDDN